MNQSHLWKTQQYTYFLSMTTLQHVIPYIQALTQKAGVQPENQVFSKMKFLLQILAGAFAPLTSIKPIAMEVWKNLTMKLLHMM